jgi:hypothetical protein
MTGLWNDFNSAQGNANLIPKGTLLKVRLTIRPGGFNDDSQGWTAGYATRGSTGSVYLNAEYTVLEGQYAKRKIFSLIGLYSTKGPDWGNMGRSLVRGILNSARGISDKDNSPEAQAKRRIAGFADLDGLEFVVRADMGTDTNGDDKNEVRSAVTPDHKDYAGIIGQVMAPMGGAPTGGYGQPSAPQAPGYAPQAPQTPTPSYAPQTGQTPAPASPVTKPQWAE